MIYSMKASILLLLLLTVTLVNSQSLSTKDSTNILAKSKLLTVSEYGIANKEQIMMDIEGQKAVFLKTLYKDFVFVKVDFSQPYRNLDYSTSTLNRVCSYYLAFSIKDSRFYKLGGFREVDIDDFFRDLKLRELTIFQGISGDEVADIDIYCLHEYFELNEKKRKKRGYKCLDVCKEKDETKVIIK